MFRLKNVLSADELVSIGNLLDGASWSDGRLTAGWQAKDVKNNLQISAEDAKLSSLTEIVSAALNRHTVFQFAARPKLFVPPLFSRYVPGMAYGDHVDDPIIRGMRTDLSLTLFLSEPESYDGGELVIETPSGSEAIKLPPGEAILYPSTMIHRVEAVTNGERLVAVTWVRSLVRDWHKREILLDLDMARQEIMHRHGKSHELDLIAKAAANLMREWADD
ncbi:Fe2+-dependent dioxygenase [Rhizobium sp. ZPR3]|uniref:Fe2+-dependent dioxygenase n=2 Tax=unclassified Rhizobium TaxID=2613769 RepID=A0AAU7SR57_9HYPH